MEAKAPAQKLIASCNGSIEAAQALLIADIGAFVAPFADVNAAVRNLEEHLHRNDIAPNTPEAVAYLLELRALTKSQLAEVAL